MLKKITILSLFPEVVQAGLSHGLMAKAIASQKIQICYIQIRDYGRDKHLSVDDTLYGGGAGMLLRTDVLFDAWTAAASDVSFTKAHTILLSPQGQLFDQPKAHAMITAHEHIILVCGHYEGVDERFIETCVDQELSIGDYVLNGGEIAALVVSDVLIRLIPGVIGSAESVTEDSLEGGLLKYPQYTKPREFQGKQPPEILFSGHHANIQKWRSEQAIERTQIKRPDLWQKYLLKNLKDK